MHVTEGVRCGTWHGVQEPGAAEEEGDKGGPSHRGKRRSAKPSSVRVLFSSSIDPKAQEGFTKVCCAALRWAGLRWAELLGVGWQCCGASLWLPHLSCREQLHSARQRFSFCLDSELLAPTGVLPAGWMADQLAWLLGAVAAGD